LRLKHVPVLDVIVLAGFYIARIMGGSAAIAVRPSPWLVAFSTFLFVSLALVKRYGELVTLAIVDGKGTRARGYLDTDKELLASMGAASGFVAVLVLAIFISTGAAEIHYARHQLVWLLCPTLLFWISYVWLTAHRGQMYDDPLVFTLRDRVSRLAIIAAALILLGAR
jgi:4-hydroxybenzoate polyprenyltransferase